MRMSQVPFLFIFIINTCFIMLLKYVLKNLNGKGYRLTETQNYGDIKIEINRYTLCQPILKYHSNMYVIGTEIILLNL